MAPLTVQRSSGCLIGIDYPPPIVDHNIKSKENIKNIQKAYEENKKKGDDHYENSKPQIERGIEPSFNTSKQKKLIEYFERKDSSKVKNELYESKSDSDNEQSNQEYQMTKKFKTVLKKDSKSSSNSLTSSPSPPRTRKQKSK
jgi:hypothetical protein